MYGPLWLGSSTFFSLVHLCKKYLSFMHPCGEIVAVPTSIPAFLSVS